jgi:hypothetical protein
MPDALDSALILAPLPPTQLRIARNVVRLTYGCRRRTVYLSAREMAERCGRRYSGAFARAIADLVKEGVLFQVDPPRGRRPGLYAINKHHWNWGRYSVPEHSVERLFDTRLSSNDARFREWESTTPGNP